MRRLFWFLPLIQDRPAVYKHHPNWYVVIAMLACQKAVIFLSYSMHQPALSVSIHTTFCLPSCVFLRKKSHSIWILASLLWNVLWTTLRHPLRFFGWSWGFQTSTYLHSLTFKHIFSPTMFNLYISVGLWIYKNLTMTTNPNSHFLSHYTLMIF